MGREILQQICLEFQKENKEQVLNLLGKDELLEDGKIKEQGEEYLILETYNFDLDDEFFEKYKKHCTYISKNEYECVDELSFIWEEED